MTFSSVAYLSCSKKSDSNVTYDDFKKYVIERSEHIENYYDKEWHELEAEYNDKKLKAEEKMDEWSEETKAEFASLKSDWEEFKDQYDAERARRFPQQGLAVIDSELLPGDIKSDLSNVTPANIIEVHKHFVNYVEAHKDALTPEQWNHVQMKWEALGARKDAIEKDLSTEDNIKLAEWKVKYGTIKAINRPTANVDGQ